MDSQVALDESTRREIEQLQMILEMKNEREADPAACKVCEVSEEENEILRDQNDKQGEIIEKLSETQELMMLQYKILELSLNKELLQIAKSQEELNNFKEESENQAPPEEEEGEQDKEAEEKVE